MKKKIAVFALASLMCAGVAGGAVFLGASAKEEWSAGVGETEIEEKYRVGETVTLPEYTLEHNGKTVVSDRILIFPDGTATHEKTVNFSKAGNYVVQYNAEIDGKVFSHTVGFVVDYASYSFSGKESSATYGTYTEYGSNSAGLIVRLAGGETLNFTKLIDVNSLTYSDKIIQGFITPDRRGSADFDKLTVTLTDYKDPSVYLKFDLNRYTQNTSGTGYTFVSAGANGQDMVGYEDKKNGDYKLHVNDDVGAPFVHSWTAKGSGAWGASSALLDFVPDSTKFDVRYDAKTLQTFVAGTFISDLDDAFYYSSLWSGFKSGKAKLSLSASGYSSQTANFCLTEVLGVDLQAKDFYDTEAPVITVDTEYEEFPEGAPNVAYRVPAATAYDEYSGAVDVRTSVVYDFASQTPMSVPVKDGTFVPGKKGWYKIVYRAEDAFGTASEVAYLVHVGNEIAPLTVTAPDGKQESVTLGEQILIQSPVVGGGSGNKEIGVSVSGDGNTYELTKDGAGAYSFRPDAEGEWTVTYTVRDYIGNTAETKYTVTASRTDVPVFIDEVHLPPVYISGSKYILPEVYVNDYSSGRLERKLSKVRVALSDGTEREYNAGDEFVPATNKEKDEISVVYHYGATALPQAKVPVIVARNGDEVFVRNYFYGTGFTLSDRDETGKRYDKGLMLSADSAAATTGWTFANALLAENFSMEFTAMAGKTQFSALRVTLTDAENPNVAAQLLIKMKTVSTELVCGDTNVALNYSFKTDTRSGSIGYAQGNFVFDSVKIPVTATAEGKAFTSFPSNKVWVRVEMLEPSAGAGYKIDSVSGNTMGLNADFGQPNVSVLGSSGGNQSIGAEYKVMPALAGDALAPNVSLSVTVTDPNGGIVTDKSGNKLENVGADATYTILLGMYGRYRITYTATETDWVSRTNKRVYTEYVFVIDEVIPEIKLTSDYTKNAKVGDVIVLPDYTVTDNISDPEHIVVIKSVLTPNGKLLLLSGESNSIRCDYEGEYVFRIMAKDEFGNVAIVYVKTNVTK